MGGNILPRALAEILRASSLDALRMIIIEASRRHTRRSLLVESGSRGDGEFGGYPFGGRLAGARNGLAAANPNFNRAGDDAANAVVVDGAQVTVVKSE